MFPGDPIRWLRVNRSGASIQGVDLYRMFETLSRRSVIPYALLLHLYMYVIFTHNIYLYKLIPLQFILANVSQI